MTPRQLAANAYFVAKIEAREHAAQLVLTRLAHHGKPEDVVKQVKALTD